jgi:hypothetical protein
MAFHGNFRDTQLTSDFRVDPTTADQFEHLVLAQSVRRGPASDDPGLPERYRRSGAHRRDHDVGHIHLVGL